MKEATVTRWSIYKYDGPEDKDFPGNVWLMHGLVIKDETRPWFLGENVRSSVIREINIEEGYLVTMNTKYWLK